MIRTNITKENAVNIMKLYKTFKYTLIKSFDTVKIK